MTRGGPENRSRLLRAGAAVIVASALLAAKDTGVVMAGACDGKKPPATILLKDTQRYKILRASVCGIDDSIAETTDPYQSNRIIVESKTRFLGIQFLWRTNTGTKEGLAALTEICPPDEPVAKHYSGSTEIDVYLADPENCKL